MIPDEAATIRDAMNAADNFLRWSRHHLGEGRAEQFEKARARLAAALAKLDRR